MIRKMKDSGNEWIRDIPEHWEVDRPYRVCKIIRGNCGFQKNDLRGEGDFVALQYGKTYKVDEVNDEYNFYVEESFFKKDQVVNKGDTILISTSETLEDLGHSCYYNREDVGLLGGEQMCLKPNNQLIENKFLYYATTYFNIELNQFATGLKVYRFKVNDLKRINIIIPPLEEQQKIAKFLDKKVAEIDHILEKTRESIEEYKNYKQSIITEAVTKGLNEDVPMKDSGIEWIGYIPEHWELSKLKYFTDKIGSGKTPRGGANVYSDKGITFLRSQNIYDEGLFLRDVVNISPEIDEEMENTRVYKGDVLLNITGASIGRSTIYPFEEPANVNQHVCIIRVGKGNLINKYLHYILISHVGQNAIEIFQSGANREGLNFEQISNFMIPIAKLEEQKAITNYLDQRCSQLNNLVNQKEHLLSDLEEYKKSLIYESVTGKREVI